jgi:uncharacterized membrane protein YccC
MTEPGAISIPSSLWAPIITALVSAVAGVVTTIWAVTSGRVNLNLSWAKEAQALWDKLKEMNDRLEVAAQRAIEAERAANRSSTFASLLKLEVQRLRMAIRAATDLEALKREERNIPATEAPEEEGQT